MVQLKKDFYLFVFEAVQSSYVLRVATIEIIF